ncbi:MAG: LCP family protein [Chloroflexi bacterium]|nr:LCP family protein [Chloroflexota bacterium]
MQNAHEMRPRRRSAFVAAFLSLLFPGLGHAYLGASRRALGFAAPPILAGALVAGIAVRLDLFELAGLAIQEWFIAALFVINLVALAYRAAAIVDAWRIARWLQSGPAPERPVVSSAGRSSRGGAGTLPVASLAGLVAVLLVMSTIHLAVGRYDVLLAGTTRCIFDPGASGCSSAATPLPGPSGTGTDLVTPDPGALGTAVPFRSATPWNGTERLNILLIGADEQGGGHNTDSMITLSIDPVTSQVAMFQIPRDTVDVPIPPGPARKLFGSVYAGKINAWFAAVRNRPDLYPGTDQTRGYNGLKAILGELFGLDIKYYVEVNFDGFRKVVDALGGVTINVQVPVVDDRYPTATGGYRRLYIPSGMQFMSGAEALAYARSRHGSTDFDRSARQQRVLLALRQQTDIARVLPHLEELASALSASIRTDIPRDLLPRLLGLAEQISSRSVRSFIFTPPYYQTEYLTSPRGYIIVPRVDRIRAAVRGAFTADAANDRREQLTAEAATIYVLNGSGSAGQASGIADYLEFLGLAASAPGQKPDVSRLAATTIRIYNGAELTMPLTVAALEGLFGVKADLVTDGAATADIVIITGSNTPALTPPPIP